MKRDLDSCMFQSPALYIDGSIFTSKRKKSFNENFILKIEVDIATSNQIKTLRYSYMFLLLVL